MNARDVFVYLSLYNIENYLKNISILQFHGNITLLTYEKKNGDCMITNRCSIFIISHCYDNIMRIILFSRSKIFKSNQKRETKPCELFLRIDYIRIREGNDFLNFPPFRFTIENFTHTKCVHLYQHLNFTNAMRSQSKRNFLKKIIHGHCVARTLLCLRPKFARQL